MGRVFTQLPHTFVSFPFRVTLYIHKVIFTSRLGTISRLEIFVVSFIKLFQSSKSIVLEVRCEKKTLHLHVIVTFV